MDNQKAQDPKTENNPTTKEGYKIKYIGKCKKVQNLRILRETYPIIKKEG